MAERVVLRALHEKLNSRQNLEYVLRRVGEEVGKLCSNLPETIRMKHAELAAEERTIANFVEFIAEGRGSRAVSEALRTAEQRADNLRVDLVPLEASRDVIFEPPPVAWIEERITRFQEILEKRSQQAALLLRKVLGPLTLEPTQGDIGRPYYRARSKLDLLALLEDDSDPDGSESRWNAMQKWRRGESKTRRRPK